MRDIPGRRIPVPGRAVYVEESGEGPGQVVFEAGSGCGRTCWDPLLPLLAGEARLVTYDRAGRTRSGPAGRQLGLDDLAADLVSMTEAVVPGEFVLVAHSMGGLVARAAAERLGPRLRGLLLVDPTPETSPVYDTWDRTTAKIDRALAVTQALSRFRPLARLFGGNLRRLYADRTYRTMLAEDFTPTGIAQTRAEMRIVAEGIRQLRARPPRLPECPTIVLSAGRAAKGRERQNAAIREHQRRYAQTLPAGRHETVDSAHFVHAEQPRLVAARIRGLLPAPGHPAGNPAAR
ncbi:alpha/beta fold hydrolase [Amycolatopsis orientalis]|uniref:alpha/beta fold hydrolase n=1 Tax=Amycolatopsis orientalis TaxID=31958 RepID=UPI0006867BC1|nr:alpha/beta hydrolase [Amycolatopsis orientalis]